MKSTLDTNREKGKFFEQHFQAMAKQQNILPIRNALSTRFIGRGKRILIKSQLDFTLVTADGKVGFFDCKSFSDRFSHSAKAKDISPHQIELAAKLWQRKVIAGFVVWFDSVDKICFFPPDLLIPGKTMGAENGVPLGNIANFMLPISMNLMT